MSDDVPVPETAKGEEVEGCEGEGCDVSERVLQLFSTAQTVFKEETERREVGTMEPP